jgi:hypothetical protein
MIPQIEPDLTEAEAQAAYMDAAQPKCHVVLSL